jgi:fibronectin-binding autotransporter adhesin
MGVALSTVGNNKIVIDAAGGAVVINSAISGAGGIELIRNAGTSRLDFGGNNSYAGDTVLTSGRMRILAAAAGNGIPNGTGTGNLVMSAGTQFGIVANETINGLSGSGTVDNDLASGTATLTIGDNDQSSSFSGTLLNSGASMLAITKIGTGTLSLSGANTYSGATIVGMGTLQLGAADVIPDGSGKGSVTVSGTLDLNTFSETINGLSGAGTIDTVAGGAPTLSVGGGNGGGTFSGAIQNTAGVFALTKTGTGTQVLSGTNTYSGATTISAGVLGFAKQASLYNNTPASWTDTNIVVSPGAAAAFSVG